MTLDELTERLRQYAEGGTSREELAAWFLPLLAADPLDVELSDAEPWRQAPHETRLFWRLVYLFDSSEEPDALLRPLAARVCAALASTADPSLTHELLPVLADQDRFCTIVAKHLRGVISRTGFLSVIAESGYPDHVKLWLEHAPAPALRQLCGLLEASRYREAAAVLERSPRG